MIPRFYPILDTAAVLARGGNVRVLADLLLESGVKILQYRHKESWTQTEYDDAAHIAQLCHSAQIQFILNDRVDFAALLKAGVHLGQMDLPPTAARGIVDKATTIGFSTHNKRQLVLAQDEPVDYLALGPIFATTSKLGADPVVGIDRLKLLRPFAKKPLVAIGGITIENAPSVMEAGADAVAVLSGFLADDCNKRAIQKKVKQWMSL